MQRQTEKQQAPASIAERNRNQQAQPDERERIKKVKACLPPLLEVGLRPNGPFRGAFHYLLEKLAQRHRYVGDDGTGNDRALQLWGFLPSKYERIDSNVGGVVMRSVLKRGRFAPVKRFFSQVEVEFFPGHAGRSRHEFCITAEVDG